MKNGKRTLATLLSAALCLGASVPSVYSADVAQSASDPLSAIDASSYTKLDFGSNADWTWTLVNRVEPMHKYTEYKEQKCV